MKIIVDAMGGDNAPMEIVKGAVMASEEFDTNIILTGAVEKILKCLNDAGYAQLPPKIEIANATQVVEMEDDPSTVTRAKKDSSMSVGLKMLAEGAADAMVSAGNTGALLSGATLIVKRIRGIRRAAVAPFLPSATGEVLIIDSGANAECTPEYLLQFAYMGSFYVKASKGLKEPKVGLLNIGTEETRGTALQKEAYKLLTGAGNRGDINFVGNVEARDVLSGVCDVVVCDGFSGNVLLKSVEGSAMFLMKKVKQIFMKNAMTKMAALMVKGQIADFKKSMSYEEIGGTAFIGIRKPVIKAHGSSNAYSIRSAIKQAIEVAKSDISSKIEENIESMKIVHDTHSGSEGEIV